MKPAYLALAGLALAAGGHLTGRYLQPAKIETVVEVKTVEVERVVTRVQHHYSTDIKWKTVRVRTPDGTETTTTEGESKTKGGTDTTVTEKTETKAAEKTTKVTDARDTWRAGALVGVSVGGSSGLTLLPVYGGYVERRIVGPVHAGVWAAGSTRVGVVGGVSLGVTF